MGILLGLYASLDPKLLPLEPTLLDKGILESWFCVDGVAVLKLMEVFVACCFRDSNWELKS